MKVERNLRVPGSPRGPQVVAQFVTNVRRHELLVADLPLFPRQAQERSLPPDYLMRYTKQHGKIPHLSQPYISNVRRNSQVRRVDEMMLQWTLNFPTQCLDESLEMQKRLQKV
jgi:hypothetical protein